MYGRKARRQGVAEGVAGVDPGIAEEQRETMTEEDKVEAEDAVSEARIIQMLDERGLPEELAVIFAYCNEGEVAAALDAILNVVDAKAREAIRKRIAGTAPAVGGGADNQQGVMRRAFGLP
jgi:hypothetical protein